jgi:hypothetical protein
VSVTSTVQPGYATLTDTFSGMSSNSSLYVLVRPTGNDTWIVQQIPLTYVNGTYVDHLYFNTHGKSNSQQFDVLAIITSNTINAGDSITKLPKTLAEPSCKHGAVKLHLSNVILRTCLSRLYLTSLAAHGACRLAANASITYIKNYK